MGQAIAKADNRFLIMDSILREIAEELDISPSKYQQAVERYTSVGRHLEGGQYPGTSGEPQIYVQGSFRLGTIVRPLRGGKEAEYDIDLACELGASVHNSDPERIKQMVGDRLKEHGTYSKMLEKEGRRCWTLIYAEEEGAGFHLDTLPCVPHPISSPKVLPRYGEQAIAITNRDEPEVPYEWRFSNPNGFADWFADSQRQAFLRAAALQKSEISKKYAAVYASVGDVPDQLVRTPLQRVVQLLKRHRDARFSGRENEWDKPISIIITTLAARAYQQETDVFSALVNIIDRIQRYQDTGIIECVDGEWRIENPANPEENFAERWNDEGSERADAFFAWLEWVKSDLDSLLNASSDWEVETILQKAFGETPGKRVAANHRGLAPGAQNVPRSLFGRVAGALIRFDAPHKQQPRWHVQASRYEASVRARYYRNGFRPTWFESNSSPLPKNVDIEFELLTKVPKPYAVHWQVVNTGHEASRVNQLRGGFYDCSKSGRIRKESTLYRGTHWVEGFVVKDGVCVARTGEFVVNIK